MRSLLYNEGQKTLPPMSLAEQLRQDFAAADIVGPHLGPIFERIASYDALLASEFARHHESAERLLDILNLAPMALFVKDADSRFFLVNRACEEHWGLRFAELRGKDGGEFFPAAQMARFMAQDREVFSGGRAVDFEEIYWSAKLGENRWAHTYKRPIYDAAGKPLLLVCATIDITQRKQDQAALSDSEARLRASILHSPIPTMMHAEDGSVLMVSRAWTEITGYSQEQIPRIEIWLKKAHGADAAQILKLMPALFDRDAVRQEGEYRVRTASGDLRLWDFHTQPLPRLPDGRRVVLSVGVDVTERRRMEAELQVLAVTDPLTALPNRRYLLAAIERELARIKRFETERAAVLMLDLDHFKRVNDTLGHAGGDAVLRHFADMVRDSLRATDTAGRMGGEEFAMVLPGTDLEMAKGFAERLRRVLARCPPQHNGVAVPITVSIGVAGLRPTDTSAATALARADEALFRAKDMGRDRVLGTA